MAVWTIGESVLDDEISNEIDELQDFIGVISHPSRRIGPATVGFFVLLSQDEVVMAQRLNSVFCRLNWGIINKPGNHLIQADEVHVIKQLVSKGQRVLEVGCGSGRITSFLSSFPTSLTAIDSEAEPIRTAQFANPSVLFVQVRANSFDTEIPYSCVFCLENMIGQILTQEERLSTLKNIARVTAKGGVMAVSFRVSKFAEEFGRPVVQAMPYDFPTARGRKRACGLSVNWTTKSILEELDSSVGTDGVEIWKGSSRPAGGRMHYAIKKF